VAGATDGGHAGRQDCHDAQQGEHDDRAADRDPEVGPPPERHQPHRVHGVLHRAHDAEAGPQRETDADDETGARVPAQRMRAALQVGADDGEVREGRAEDGALQRRMAAQHDAEHGDQHQEQREQREEAPVGDECGEATGLVVAELPHDREGERQGTPALLEPV
jgi:hypothetical protein